MENPVSAADANQDHFRLLREAQAGDTIVITLDGRPVAQHGPAPRQGSEAARRALLERLRSVSARNLGRWSRDDLYD